MNKNGRRSNTIWNMFFGYANIGVSLVRNILLVPLYLKYIDLAEYGAWLATGSVLLNMIMTDFGLAGATTQRVSFFSGKQLNERLGQVIITSFLSSIIIALLLSLITWLAAPYITGSMQLEGAMADRLHECFLLAMFANAIVIPGMISISILKSLKYTIQAGVIYTVTDIISLICSVILLFSGYGLYAIVLGLVTRSALLMLISVFYCYFKCKRDYQLRTEVSISEARILFSNTGYLFLSTLAMKIQTQSDVFFVGLFSGPTSAGVYGLTLRGFETVFLLVSQINHGLAPSLANLYGSADKERLRQVVTKLPLIILFVGAVGLGCFVLLNRAFVTLWVGEHAYAGDMMTCLLGISGYVFLLGAVAYDILGAFAEYRMISRVFLFTALVHVLTIFLVIEFINPWVVPLAMLVSTSVWGSIFWKYVTARLGANTSGTGLLSIDLLTMGITTFITVCALWQINPVINDWFTFSIYAIALIFVLSFVNLLVGKKVRNTVLGEIKITFNRR